MSFDKLKKQSKGFLKRFLQDPLPDLPEIEQINGEPYRLYRTPEGNLYPSVTSILGYSPVKKDFLEKWKERIGEENAIAETKRASDRGTNVHLCAENYLNNLPYDTIGKKTDRFLFSKMKPILDDHVDRIRAQEIRLWSDALQAAGTCDCVAEYDGTLSVIDFKTSSKEKLAEWIGDYFLQCTMYSLMIEERFGIKIPEFVIIIAVEQGTTQVFKGNRKDYLDILAERLIQWRKHYKEVKYEG